MTSFLQVTLQTHSTGGETEAQLGNQLAQAHTVPSSPRAQGLSIFMQPLSLLPRPQGRLWAALRDVSGPRGGFRGMGRSTHCDPHPWGRASCAHPLLVAVKESYSQDESHQQC